MSFYPIIKKHISPSAFQSWHNSRSQFMKSYFAGERTPETAAMKAGTAIHAMIEIGVIKVQHKFEKDEETLAFAIMPDGTTEPLELGEEDSYNLPDTALAAIFGRPDSFDVKADADGNINFVDYKSGKVQTWDDEKLATDLKMKATAYLVLKNAQNAGEDVKKVTGSIEYIPTQWNDQTREIEATDGDTVVAGVYEYDIEDLENFVFTLRKTIEDVNAAYSEWLESTDEFIDRDDVVRYAELDQIVKEAKKEMETISTRIGEQMELGSKLNYSNPAGTFYFRETKTWEYPEELTKAKAHAAAQLKKFETDNEPVEIKRSLSFRAKKTK